MSLDVKHDRVAPESVHRRHGVLVIVRVPIHSTCQAYDISSKLDASST